MERDEIQGVDQNPGLTAKRHTDNTRAIRLAHQLQDWRCPICKANNPRVVKTLRTIRYVRCRCCQNTTKLPNMKPTE